MYAGTPNDKPWTVPALADAKRDGRKLVMLTCYDAGFARTMDDAGIDLVLIGDSLGMVVQGHDSTLPVTTADIAYHTSCVARGLDKALLICAAVDAGRKKPEDARKAFIAAAMEAGLDIKA